MFNPWPPIAVLALLATALTVMMLIAGIFGYELNASLWKVVFRPWDKDRIDPPKPSLWQLIIAKLFGEGREPPEAN